MARMTYLFETEFPRELYRTAAEAGPLGSRNR